MGCCRFFYLIIPTLLTIAALLLTALACAGSSKNNTFLTNIYYIDLDFSDMNATAILASAISSSSSLSSEIDSLDDSDTSLNQQLGLSDVYSFGMWGYCKGDIKSGDSLDAYDTNAVEYTYCSDPKAMYVFDPASVILADLTNSTDSDSSDAISTIISAVEDIGIDLPSGVESYEKIISPLSKLIFICTLIGLALGVVQLILSVFAICSRAVSCFVFILAIIELISLILACAVSTGAFVYMRKEFNNEVSDYGITANLSRNYLVFYWVSVVAAALAAFFWLFSICCCSTGPTFRRRAPPPPPMEEKY